MPWFTALLFPFPIGDINRFDSAVKLRAYAGMDPVTKQSGNYNISSHISKRGNPLMRYALYLSTISAIRFNPVAMVYCTVIPVPHS